MPICQIIDKRSYFKENVMKSFIKRNISFILVLAFVMSVSSLCFSLPSSAASGLKSTRELLGEYIAELFLKGPSVSSSVRENLISKGLANDGLLEKRAEFDLRLCSSDEYNGYFFTDKEDFLSSAFGVNGEVFLEGIYVWYPSVSAAKRANAGPTMNDPLIKYNISNALNFAIDVYGMCEDDDGAFSDKFNDSRKNLASYAIDCLYKIINALENQRGEGTAKPTYYRNDFAETFCTEESGLYPYLDERFRKNTPVMTGFLDSSTFTKKTFSYSELKESMDTAARLSAFEAAYGSLKAQKDGKMLYYDFLTAFDRARNAYNDLCSIVLSGENPNPDITEKAAVYLKLKSLGEIFASYILPYADSYPAELSAMSINYTTIKTLIFFVDNNPFYLSFISLSAMRDLADNFTQSVSKLSPAAEYALTAAGYDKNKYTGAKLIDHISRYEGITDEKGSDLYERASSVVSMLKTVSVPEVRITVPTQTFYGANAAIITSEPFTFTLIPSVSLYIGLVNQLRSLCYATDTLLEDKIPLLLSSAEKEVLPIEKFINSYSFIFGSALPTVCRASGKTFTVSFSPSAKALLKKLLSDTWGVENVDDGRVFALDRVFNAGAEYCAYKKGDSYGYLTSEETVELYGFYEYLSDKENVLELLKKAVAATERDNTVYGYGVRYEAQNAAELWRLTRDGNSGLYITVTPPASADGADPSNYANYRAGAFSKMISALNDTLTALNDGSSSAKLFVAAERFSSFAKELLSDYGKERYEVFKDGISAQSQQYFGSSDMAYEMFKSLLDGKGAALKNLIVLDQNGKIPASEAGYRYFAFTVSAASQDETHAANLYSFADDRIITNLISPLEVILANRITYTGSYSSDFAEKTTKELDTAQLLVSSVDRLSKTVGYEITVPEAEELLATLSQVSFTRSKYTVANIASYKATALDALIDKARSKTIDQSDTTPYYRYICDLFSRAYTDAFNVSRISTIPTADIDEAANNLSMLLALIEDYEKHVGDSLITVKDFDQKISEAQTLLDRYDISEPNTFITDLEKAVADAKAEYAAKLTTFTAEDLKLEIKKLDNAILQVKNSLIIDELMKKEIAKITASVKSSSNYTAQSWDEYSRALGTAELAAARDTEKVSVCNSCLEALKDAVAKLEIAKEETTAEEQTGETQPEPESEPETEQTETSEDAFLKQANDIYAKSVAELAEYTLSANANAEKTAAWSAAISRLKGDIDAKKSQQELLSDIIAVQLAKNLQIENPETIDE